MSFSLFNLQREHYEVKTTSFMKQPSFTSKVSCRIPKLKICFAANYSTPSSTSPSKYVVSSYQHIGLYKNNEASPYLGKRLSINSTDIAEIDPDMFWSLNGLYYTFAGEACPDTTFANYVELDLVNQKVTYVKEVFAIKLTGGEDWLEWDINDYTYSGTNCKVFQGYVRNTAPFSTSGPFQSDLRCSHYAYDGTGGQNPTIQNSWTTRGPSIWVVYNPSGITTLKEWIKYLAAQNANGTPVTMYTPRDLPDYSDMYRESRDITDTALGQYLLNNLSDLYQVIGNITIQAGANTTLLSTMQLNYLDSK